MNPEILTAAKEVSIWALAIIAVYFVADTVLKGDATSARVWYVKLGSGLMFGVFLLILAIASVLLPRVGWAPIKQLGDWAGQDIACTKSDTPRLTMTGVDGRNQALCDFAHLGHVAVCWGARSDPTGTAGIYPPGGNLTSECQGETSWCTYKSEQASPLQGNGPSPGKVFVCARLLD
jgi:hypothetical protein